MQHAAPAATEAPRLHLDTEPLSPAAAPRAQEMVRVEPPAARPVRVAPKKSGTGFRPWLVAAAVAVLGTSVLFGAHRSARQNDDAASVEAMNAPVDTNPLVAPPPSTEPTVQAAPQAVKPAPAPVPKTAFISEAAFEKHATPVVEPIPVAARAVEPAPLAAAPVMPPAADAIVGISEPPVTISGCLERNNDGFVLKKTSGAEAPKSRSWKTGFLKSHTANIDLVGPSDSLHLERFVGERVTATGLLENKEMQPRSVKKLAASCD